VSDREHIEQFFAYEHLPETLQAVSRPFGELAKHIVALRKLLEAKDAAVRASVARS
jgi:hypothetical protein